MSDFSLIKNYIDLIKSTLCLDIIIYDECRLLSQTELSKLAELSKWHINEYCLKIKENKALHRRCVNLKRSFSRKLRASSRTLKSTCFCGVCEYAVPIKVNERLICIVSAVGYKGRLSQKMLAILCGRINLSKKDFIELRDRSLLEVENEQAIISALEILAQLIKEFIIEKADYPFLTSDSYSKTDEYVLKAIKFINENFAKPINSISVARYCHISTSYLQYLFSQVRGHGIAEEIRNCRLSYARELLSTTQYSVKYIAYICGFSSSDYFVTVFKKYCKMTPLKYRKTQNLKKQN